MSHGKAGNGLIYVSGLVETRIEIVIFNEIFKIQMMELEDLVLP